MQSSPHSELTVTEIVFAIWRRRQLIYICTFICFLLGILVCIVVRRSFEASATIQVQKENSGGLDPDSLAGGTQSTGDALDQDINIQTQARILHSDTLSLDVIRSLRLDETPDFRGGRFHFLGQAKQSPDPHGELQAGEISKADSAALRTFQNHLVITPQPGTRLITVAYMNSDPRRAALIVNTLVKKLIDFDFQSRYKATELASTALTKQLGELRTRSEALQKQVAQMQLSSGIYSLGTTDAQGRQQAYSSVLDTFQRAATTMNEAEQDRFLKGAIYRAANSGDAEALSSLAGNSGNGVSSPGIANFLTTVQNLRTQEAALKGQLNELKVKFGPGYPRIAELQGNLSGVDAAIRSEIGRVRSRAKSDYQVSQQTYTEAQTVYKKDKVAADALNDQNAKYLLIKQEADDSRILYEDLLKRVKEAGIFQDLKSNSITVVDGALVPQNSKKPNVPIYLLASLGAGLFLGIFGILVAETVDDKVRTAESLRRADLPVFALLPQLGPTDNPFSAPYGAKPSQYGEAVRSLRFKLETGEESVFPRVLVIASVDPCSSTTALVCRLAEILAKSGSRTLLVEADLQNPKLAGDMRLSPSGGLSRMLAGGNSLTGVIEHPLISNLYVLPAGVTQPTASELIDSPRMRELMESWRTSFDVVLISAAPLLLVADAFSLSKMSDICLLLAQTDTTSLSSLQKEYEALSRNTRVPTRIVLVTAQEYGGRWFHNKAKTEVQEGAHEHEMV